MSSSGYVELSTLDLTLAASLILINAAISVAFSLKLERTLLINTVRMVVQLALIGLVLKWIFTQTSPLWTLALALIMIGVAGYEVAQRQDRRFKGWRTYGLGTGTLLFVGLFGTVFAVAGVIGPEPWYQPRYVLPILGMVLGNCMTGVALALGSVTDIAARERVAIEARLALGEPRFKAFEEVLHSGLRTGLMPILNAMAASGIVSLPGMMTGQILAGADPVDATKYQILIMFLIAGTTALGVVIAGFGGIMMLTDDRHRLRLDRLRSSDSR